MADGNLKKLNVLMVGSGEYVTGYTGAGASKSDKKIGVVGLTLFNLRRLGIVDQLSMVGVNGRRFPEIRTHLAEKIEQVYQDMDVSFKSYPDEDKADPEAYKTAIDAMSPGDAVIIFTPDSTHAPIAEYALERGLHVQVTKPATQKLADHQKLIALAEKHGVLCTVEHHKRFDPAYADAKGKAALLGDFNFWSSWMSQPKTQLETFKAWAGRDSDISYYLNSHHVDIHCWIMGDKAYPTRVTASASAGIATAPPYSCVPQTEDTITLLVDWVLAGKEKTHKGTAVYTASWTAPTSQGIHTGQHFHYMGSKGDIAIDQAHRGYDVTVDGEGKASYNPFYMKYTPDASGRFDGEHGYGYISIAKFVDWARQLNAKVVDSPAVFDAQDLPTIKNTVLTTAILEAGRRSLDEKRTIGIEKDANGQWILV